jgi:hypothetical protein
VTSGKDPAHWLYRLTPVEWLSAADTEVAHAAEALGRRALRPGITHARRAAGMAWNAVLAGADDEALVTRYGRSYMDHVTALASATDVSDEVRAAAQLLRDTPPLPPALITLGKPDMRALDAARLVIAHARTKIALGVPTSTSA